MSFTVAPGELVALVGPSGAGKTTTALLVPRIHDVVDGRGRASTATTCATSRCESLRGTVGMVMQDPHLFHETHPGQPALRPARRHRRRAGGGVHAAARIHDLIATLPDGYDTVVGERGYRMSGGEKQRLAIARMLLKDPAIVILDEATSHLDSESEVAIQRALADALEGRTALVIAHRLSTIVERRPDPRARRRRDRRGGHSRRAPRPRRPLRRPVPDAAPPGARTGLTSGAMAHPHPRPDSPSAEPSRAPRPPDRAAPGRGLVDRCDRRGRPCSSARAIAVGAAAVLSDDGGPSATPTTHAAHIDVRRALDARPRHHRRRERSAAAASPPTRPLRLWIAGDSIAWSVGNGLGKLAAATGVVAPVYESRVSSGVSSPGFFDWPQRVAEELPSLNPEVVVFVMGTNDWMAPQPTPLDATGQPAWKGKYQAQVQALVDALARDGRILYWLGPPILKDPKQDAGAQAAAAVIKSVVAGHPDAHFVDAHALLDADDGSYTPTMDVDGKKVLVRAGDGVHLTPEGGDFVGGALFDQIDQQCSLKAQSVPEQQAGGRRDEGLHQRADRLDRDRADAAADVERHHTAAHRTAARRHPAAGHDTTYHRAARDHAAHRAQVIRRASASVGSRA